MANVTSALELMSLLGPCGRGHSVQGDVGATLIWVAPLCVLLKAAGCEYILECRTLKNNSTQVEVADRTALFTDRLVVSVMFFKSLNNGLLLMCH